MNVLHLKNLKEQTLHFGADKEILAHRCLNIRGTHLYPREMYTKVAAIGTYEASDCNIGGGIPLRRTHHHPRPRAVLHHLYS